MMNKDVLLVVTVTATDVINAAMYAQHNDNRYRTLSVVFVTHEEIQSICWRTTTCPTVPIDTDEAITKTRMNTFVLQTGLVLNLSVERWSQVRHDYGMSSQHYVASSAWRPHETPKRNRYTIYLRQRKRYISPACPRSFVCVQDYSKTRAWIWMKCCVSTDVGT